MTLPPKDRAKVLSAIQQELVKAAVTSGLGIGEDNALPLDKIIDQVHHSDREKAEGALFVLEGELFQTWEDGGQVWLWFTPRGRTVATHVMNIFRKRAAEAEPVPELPFDVDNPTDQDWEVTDAFRSEIEIAERDGRIREALKTKMEKILRKPERGEPKSGPLKGLLSDHVAHNKVILWAYQNDKVTFRFFWSHDDPRYGEGPG